MSAHSLTWQSLPEYLLEPVMAEVVLLSQAAEIWDRMLMSPEHEESVEMPPHLQPVLERLLLWTLEAEPTLH
jgi:hypothetical protein